MKNLLGIVNGTARIIENDPWQLVADSESELPGSYQIVSVESWQQIWKNAGEELARRQVGVMLRPDDDPAILSPWISLLPVIALCFESFRDGRAYSQAYLLRSRYGFEGDLRAVGDVLRDQLASMRHCGFTSFSVREDKSVEDALKGLAGFDMIYARSVINPEPLFRRRQAPS